MKKVLFILFAFVASFAASTNNTYASVANYSINDEAVEALFNSGVQVASVADDSNFMSAMGINEEAKVQAGSKNGWIAFIICWFVGSLGIHRAYLGTATGVIIGYILTCGGLGIVTLIDWIVLLLGAVNGDVSKYEDNKKFFMW